MFSPIHTTPMFVDGMRVKASWTNPCVHVYHQQGVDGKPVSKKRCKIFVDASNLAVTLLSFAKSSN